MSDVPRVYDCPIHGQVWEYLDPNAGPCARCENEFPDDEAERAAKNARFVALLIDPLEEP